LRELNLPKLKELLLSGAKTLDVNIDHHNADQFMMYLELLLRWNKAFNLTAVTDPKQVVIKHFLDSIAVAPYVSGQRILDVGAGAGLPGIPLALLYPQILFVLLDTNGKKTRFMQQAVAELRLENVEVVKSRVESYIPDEKFDQIFSRAFSSIDDKINGVAHLLKPHARIMAMKGGVPTSELSNIKSGFELISVHHLNVPELEGEERHLIEISFSVD